MTSIRTRQRQPKPNPTLPFQRPPPDLPPEIWLLILRLTSSSTSTSPLSTPSYCGSSHTVSFLDFPHPHSHLAYRLAQYQRVMQQRLLFTQVCKAWHSYAQELLFEFVWISNGSQAQALAGILASTPTKGIYILRLHIETPTLGRCCPDDILTILEHTPRLVVYSDYRSIRRYAPTNTNPPQLLDALAHPNAGTSLRRLSWTNYSTREGDGEDNVSFCLRMSPLLENAGIAANLEFLELTFCSTHLRSMYPSSSTLLYSKDRSPCPGSTIVLTPAQPTLCLPSLRSLKITLDNATFLVLATWHMPLLVHLSVLSSDYSYSLAPHSYSTSGFARFFEAHGGKLTQLELGHSSATIEEHYLTDPAPGSRNGEDTPGGLARWCPNLIQFICSADAEWNWQSPDLIAPHVLLPSHPALQFIGIRDLDKRLQDDMDLARGGEGQEFFMLLEQMGSLLRKEAFPMLRYIRDMSWRSDLMRKGVRFDGVATISERRPGSSSSVFPGTFNFGTSLFSSATSPSLTSSNNSQSGAQVASWPTSTLPYQKYKRSKHKQQPRSELSPETKKIMRFWKAVLQRCEGDVRIQNWRGKDLQMQDLRRVEAGEVGGEP